MRGPEKEKMYVERGHIFLPIMIQNRFVEAGRMPCLCPCQVSEP